MEEIKQLLKTIRYGWLLNYYLKKKDKINIKHKNGDDKMEKDFSTIKDDTLVLTTLVIKNSNVTLNYVIDFKSKDYNGLLKFVESIVLENFKVDDFGLCYDEKWIPKSITGHAKIYDRNGKILAHLMNWDQGVIVL